MVKKPSRGRRIGRPDTRAAILRTARKCFGERGYDATTVRAIALEAVVDQALVHHYFGTKRALFDAALAPADLKSEDEPSPNVSPGDPGERLVLAFLRRWDVQPDASRIETLLRAAGSDEPAQRLLSELIRSSLATPAARVIPAATELPRLRTTLAAAQLIGLAWMRYVERREPLASASPRLLAKTFGPGVTAVLIAPKREPCVRTAGQAAAHP